MQMLQSHWLNHCRQSAISVQWLGVVDKMSTFSCFSEVLKEHLKTKIKFLSRTKKRRFTVCGIEKNRFFKKLISAHTTEDVKLITQSKRIP